MPKPRNNFVDRLQYLGLRLVEMALHSWPVNMNLQGAKLIGDVMYRFDRKHRNRALQNLRRSFPEMTEPQREKLARRSMQHLVMLGCEVLFTTRLIRIDTFAKYVQFGDFQTALGIMLKRDQGMIMVTAHYGNWEMVGYVLATLGFESTVVARPLDNPFVNDYVMGVRQRRGQKVIGKKGATTEIVDIMERRGVVAFIADQNAGAKGMFVDFFGRKASTYKSIGLLAMQYQVPIIIGGARRVRDQFRFQLGSQDIIYPEDWKDQPDPLRYITQRYTSAIEAMVREDPGQYLWVHRRWKTRPKGEEPEPYD
jgi:Kdo2-lipid IVA lauroyltransferase/acyltransferase